MAWDRTAWEYLIMPGATACFAYGFVGPLAFDLVSTPQTGN
jgi:hypothetical protein